MAQDLVIHTGKDGEEQKEGTSVAHSEMHTLKEYLVEENVLSVYSKLKSNGFTNITTLLHMNDTELSELCSALNLSLFESLKFKPAIRKLQKIYLNESNYQIDKQIEIEETKIRQSFDAMIQKLESRKMKLIQELYHANTNKSTIEYIECYKETFEEYLNKFGTIRKYSNDKKSIAEPKNTNIIAVINHKKSLICIDIKNKNKENMKSIEIYYKKKVSNNENEEKIDNWIKNKFGVIADIETLSQYDVRARYLSSDDVWSELSKTFTIDTKFECVWDDTQHINNQCITFIGHNELFFHKYCNTVSVICKHEIKADDFSSIIFEFVINEYCQTSQFGFISATQPINEIMKDYWNDSDINNNKNAFILETMDGRNNIHRYKNGKDTEETFWSNNGISIPISIKKGDHFIFNIDFNALECNVFINCNDDENSTCITRKQLPTWSHIPTSIVPAYSHAKGTKLIARTSSVQINVLDYQCRSE
eukprot:131461_1